MAIALIICREMSFSYFVVKFFYSVYIAKLQFGQVNIDVLLIFQMFFFQLYNF